MDKKKKVLIAAVVVLVFFLAIEAVFFLNEKKKTSAYQKEVITLPDGTKVNKLPPNMSLNGDRGHYKLK